ncbi:hypothetical protein ACJJV6_03225 [Arthrobacter nitrophenolicus]|uniref:hypothetical protein n=1 Tax=Arthrobacter nitrophenolicus TaxID=683150 RepID=UPI003899ECB6
MSAVIGALYALLVIAGAVSALGLAVACLRKWPVLGLYLVGLFVLVAWEIPVPINVIAAGGLQIKAEDVIVLILAVDTVLSPERLLTVTRRRNPLMVWLAVCLGVVVVGSLLIFGSSALNEARPLIWGIVCTSWFLNHDWEDAKLQQQFQKWVALIGWGLTSIFCYHAAKYGLGSADSFVSVGINSGIEQTQTGRPLVSGQAMTLACLGFILFTGKPRQGWRLVSGLVFILTAMACQHRSVWAAVAVATVFGLSRLRGSFLHHSIFWGAYSLIILGGLALAGVFDPLAESLSYSLSSSGTYREREGSWQLLVGQVLDKGPGTVAFGSPYGSGYDRVVDGVFVTYSPHNWYVIIFLRMGLFGLIGYVALLLSISVNLLARREWVAASSFFGIVIYCWAYALPWYITPVFGWCAFRAWRGLPSSGRLRPKLKYVSPAYKHLSQASTRS